MYGFLSRLPAKLLPARQQNAGNSTLSIIFAYLY